MEPGGFRIKKVGEDSAPEPVVQEQNDEISAQESEELLQELNSEVSEATEEVVVEPTVNRENPLRLAYRPGQAPIQDAMPCPECGANVDREAVICVSCGMHLKKGKQVKTKQKKASGNSSFPSRNKASKPTKRGPSALSNLIFYSVVLGVIGGLAYYFFVKPAMEKADAKKVEALCKVQLKSLGMGFPEKLDKSVKCPKSGRVYEFYWPKDGSSPFKITKNNVLVRCFDHNCGVGTDGAVKQFPMRQGLQMIGFEQMRDLVLGKVKSKADILKTLSKPFTFEPYNSFDVDHDRYTSKAFQNFKSKYGTVTVMAWREMEATNYGGRGIAIKAKKGGKKFKKVKYLAFKLPEGINDSKVKVILDDEDQAWIKKNVKK